MQKILLVLTIIFSLLTAGLGYLNHNRSSEIHSSLTSVKTESDAYKKKAATAAADLKTLKEAQVSQATEADKTTAEITELHEQIAKANSGVADVQKQLSDKDTALAQMKTDMAAKDTHIKDLEAKSSSTLQPTTAPSDDLKKQLEEKDILNASIQAKLKDQETQIAAFKERENQRRDKTMRNGLEGKILAVNSSWNFVILSLGDRNGVSNNAEMLIKRGSQLIGKVRITSVEPSSSVADIVANSIPKGLVVLPGDSVIYSGPNESSDSKL